MTDTPVKKSILRSIRDGVQWLLHVLLIPFMAVLKATDAGIQHLLTELGKV
jgi:hypothetical protein